MSFGAIGGSLLSGAGSAIAGAALGGLLGGGDQTTSTTSDLPEWLKPFYTGGADGYAGYMQGQPPISDDFIHWNTMMGMGYPIGPNPPMYVDDPRYTGQNVYQAPFNFMQPQDNLGTMGFPLQQMAPGLMPNLQGMGAQRQPPHHPLMNMSNPMIPQGMPWGMGGTQYPSQARPEQPAMTQPSAPATTGQATGPGDLSAIVDRANTYMGMYNTRARMADGVEEMGFGNALRWALDNPNPTGPFFAT